MNETDLIGRLKYLKGHVYGSSAYFGSYSVLSEKVDEPLLKRGFNRYNYLYWANRQAMRDAMVNTIMKFWDRDGRATSYHNLLSELKKRNLITAEDESEISKIRDRSQSDLQRIRTYRNQYSAHSDCYPNHVRIKHSVFEVVLAGMGEIYAIVAQCLGENDLAVDLIIEKLESETEALWRIEH